MSVDQRPVSHTPVPHARVPGIPVPPAHPGDGQVALQQADRALAAADPALPVLPLLLDPDRLSETVTTSLQQRGVPARSVVLDYLRYKQGTSVMASLRVATADGMQPVMLRGWSATRGAPTLRTQPDWEPAVEESLQYVVAPATADRRIRVDRIAAGWRPPGTEDALLAPVRYRPGRRWVGRLDAPDGTPRALLKAVRPGGVDDAVNALRRAQRHGVATTPLLAGRSRTGLLATGWVGGRECSWTVSAHAADAEAIGAALAALHTVPLLAHEPAWCADRTGRPLRRAREALRAARTLLPELAPEIADTWAGVTAAAAAVAPDPVPTGLLHGDLNAEQVVLTGGGAVLLDLDRCTPGDPVLDLASWLAHDGGGLDRVLPLVTGHQRAGGPELELGALPFLTAVATLQRAVEPFRYRQPGWADQVRARLRDARDWAELDR